MSFLSEGKKIEKHVMALFDSAVESTKEEDINKHYDFTSGDIKYDVKGLKKISRADVEPNENYHFIELKNVNGKLGWLYGEADYFVFELNEYYIVVDKFKLQDFVKDKVSKTFVSSPDEALYCLYRRNNRKDIITLVKTIDLIIISDRSILKQENIKSHRIGDSIISDKNHNKRISELLKK